MIQSRNFQRTPWTTSFVSSKECFERFDSNTIGIDARYDFNHVGNDSFLRVSMPDADLFSPNAPETLRDPYPAYARLRSEAPAYFIENWSTWALSRFEDIWKYAADREHLTATAGTTPPYLITGAIRPAENLNHLDPPQQQALRKELMQFFLPSAVRRREARIREIVVAALEPMIARGSGDVVTELGRVVATRVASEAIGFPERDHDRIHDFMGRFFQSAGGANDAALIGAEAMADMRTYLTEIASRRRGSSSAMENVIDVLLSTKTTGKQLSDEEVGDHLVPLLVGSTETFPKFASAATYRLWRNPEQRSLLVEDSSLTLNAVRECLRLDMPTQMSMRRVVRQLKLHGETLEPGHSVMFLWGSGNRDEREFTNPEQLDLRRRVSRTLSFGGGIHRCLGGHLAEAEGRILLEELIARAPDYEIDAPKITSDLNAFFHAYSCVPIQF